jgi:transcriptional regulator with XRE-family HTH domain
MTDTEDFQTMRDRNIVEMRNKGYVWKDIAETYDMTVGQVRHAWRRATGYQPTPKEENAKPSFESEDRPSFESEYGETGQPRYTLRERRESANMSQVALGEQVGCLGGMISQYETGSRPIPPERRAQIVAILGEFRDAPRVYQQRKKKPTLADLPAGSLPSGYFAEAQLEREARASIALDKGDGETQSMEGYVQRVVDQAPPLTPEQRHNLSVLMRRQPQASDELIASLNKQLGPEIQFEREVDDANQRVKIMHENQSVLCYQEEHARCMAAWCVCPCHQRPRRDDDPPHDKVTYDQRHPDWPAEDEYETAKLKDTTDILPPELADRVDRAAEQIHRDLQSRDPLVRIADAIEELVRLFKVQPRNPELWR